MRRTLQCFSKSVVDEGITEPLVPEREVLEPVCHAVVIYAKAGRKVEGSKSWSLNLPNCRWQKSATVAGLWEFDKLTHQAAPWQRRFYGHSGIFLPEDLLVVRCYKGALRQAQRPKNTG